MMRLAREGMLLLGGKRPLCLGKTGLLGGFDPGERLLIVLL